MAVVVVRLEERKPVAVLNIRGVFWIFDDQGGIDELEHQRVVGEVMEFAFSRPPDTKGKIVSLAPALARRAYEGKHRWEAKVRFVMGWLRSTTAGQRCCVVIARNPPIGGEGGWLLT